MDQASIRILSEADVDTFWKLRLRALREEPECFGSAYEEAVQTPSAEIVSRIHSSAHAFVLGAFIPELTGMAGFFRRKGRKNRHKGEVWGMYVSPENRGNGVGRALLLELISRASAMAGLEQIVLAVVTTNEAARRLYLSLGFKWYAVEREALKIRSGYLDEDLMALKLDNNS